MAGRTIKEKKILTVLGVVLAFAVFGLFYARIAQSWKDAWKGYDNERKRYRRECELIQRKPALLVEYDKEKSQMKMFDEEEDTKTTWLRRFDKLAEDHLISLTSRQAGDETQDGEVYELAIDEMVDITFHSGVKYVPANSTIWEGYPTADNPYNGPWWWWSCFKYIIPYITLVG